MGHNSTTYQLEKVQDVNDLMCDAWAGVEQNVIGDAIWPAAQASVYSVSMSAFDQQKDNIIWISAETSISQKFLN